MGFLYFSFWFFWFVFCVYIFLLFMASCLLLTKWMTFWPPPKKVIWRGRPVATGDWGDFVGPIAENLKQLAHLQQR